jgi:hypothetical protein
MKTINCIVGTLILLASSIYAFAVEGIKVSVL